MMQIGHFLKRETSNDVNKYIMLITLIRNSFFSIRNLTNFLTILLLILMIIINIAH